MNPGALIGGRAALSDSARELGDVVAVVERKFVDKSVVHVDRYEL